MWQFFAGLALSIILFVLQEAKIQLPRWFHASLVGLAVVLILFTPLWRAVLRYRPKLARRNLMEGLLLAISVGAGLGGLTAGLTFRAMTDPAPPASAPTQMPSTAERPRLSADDNALTRVRALTPLLQAKIQVADKIEYDMRDKPPKNAKQLEPFAKRIEDWRTDAGGLLSKELLASGADTKFLTFRPQGGTPASYEYHRLIAMRENLVSILDNLELYIRRSTPSPQPQPGSPSPTVPEPKKTNLRSLEDDPEPERRVVYVSGGSPPIPASVTYQLERIRSLREVVHAAVDDPVLRVLQVIPVSTPNLMAENIRTYKNAERELALLGWRVVGWPASVTGDEA